MHGKNTKGWGEGEIDGDRQRGWLWGTVQTHSTIWVNYLWSPLQPTHPFQNKAWDVSGLSGLYLHHRNTWTLKSFHCSQTSQYNLGDKSHYLWSSLQPTHPFQNKAWDVSGLSAGPTSINVTPGLWRFPTGVSVCVTGLAGAIVAWVLIIAVLVAVGIILAFVDICTSPHYQVSTMSWALGLHQHSLGHSRHHTGIHWYVCTSHTLSS